MANVKGKAFYYRIAIASRILIGLFALMLTPQITLADGIATPEQLRAAGWNAPDGATFTVIYLPWTGPRPIQCAGTDFKMDWSLDDVAATNTSDDEISINPLRLITFNQFIQAFIVGHECGHAYLNTENEYKADCFSVTTGLLQGWMTYGQFGVTYRTFETWQKNYDHPAGKKRWIQMVRDVNLLAQHKITSPDDCKNMIYDESS